MHWVHDKAWEARVPWVVDLRDHLRDHLRVVAVETKVRSLLKILLRQTMVNYHVGVRIIIGAFLRALVLHYIAWVPLVALVHMVISPVTHFLLEPAALELTPLARTPAHHRHHCGRIVHQQVRYPKVLVQILWWEHLLLRWDRPRRMANKTRPYILRSPIGF